MIKTAKGITGAEIEQAAAYFSELKPRATIKVVETATVPKTRVAGWFLAALPGSETEPIGGSIIEVPEDLERFDPTSTVLRKMVAEIRGIAGGATGRTVMWC
jgi:hypothetical protein